MKGSPRNQETELLLEIFREITKSKCVFSRNLDLQPWLRRKSVFLLGPRQTGKSTYLRTHFADALFIDLLESETYQTAVSRPDIFQDWLRASRKRTIVVDEIQRVPELLNEIHRAIELHPEFRFILSGSSARRLKRAGENLLGGRAALVRFWPIVWSERASHRSDVDVTGLDRALQFGGLPSVVLSSAPQLDLIDYVQLYLDEEIRAEAMVRNLPVFVRFLQLAGSVHSEQVAYQSLASDLGISSTTVKSYFQILEDTLLGQRIYPFRETERKAVAAPKFYFFDQGVANAVSRTFDSALQPLGRDRALEGLVYTELAAYQSYRGAYTWQLFYWRTHDKQEVDFVIQREDGRLIAVEVKATRAVSAKHYRHLKMLREDPKVELAHAIVVAQEPHPRRTESGIDILSPSEFFSRLWAGGFNA